MDHSRCVSSSGRSLREGLLAGGLQAQATEFDAGHAHRIGAANQCTAAGHQLGDMKWFGDVVVGAQVQRRDAIAHVIARGEHHHRQLEMTGAQAAHQLQAIFARQADVDHREIETLRVQRAARRARTGHDIRRESCAQQSLAHAVSDQWLVFDDEYPHGDKPTRDCAPSN